MYLATLIDGNISGRILFPVRTIAEAQDVVRQRGTWQRLPGRVGSALLSHPSITLAVVDAGQGGEAYVEGSHVTECGECSLTWDAPTPAGRCPWEYLHHLDACENEYLIEVGPRGGVTTTRL